MAPFGASRAGLMSVAADDIPDSGLTHDYDARALDLSDSDTVDPFTDNFADKDLSAVGSPTYLTDQIGDQPVASYDGDGDGHEDDGPVEVGSNDEFMFAFVVVPQSDTDDNGTMIANFQEGEYGFAFGTDESEWRAASEGEVAFTVGSLTLNDPHAGIFGFDGSNLILEIGEEQLVNESVGTDPRDESGFSVGFDGPRSQWHSDCQIGHVRPHDEMFGSDDRAEYINALEDSWGFTTPDPT